MTDKQPEALRLADELDCRGMNRPSWKDQFDAGYELRRLHKVNEALRARLAQPEQEPVAWMHDSHVGFNVPLYTAPPQREWQGLTDEERLALWSGIECDLECLKPAEFARAIEAKLKEKNT